MGQNKLTTKTREGNLLTKFFRSIAGGLALPAQSASPKSHCNGVMGGPKKIFQANCECIRPNIISNNTSKNRPTADESARRFPWCLDCPGYGASGAVMFATVSRGKNIRKRTKVIIILVVVHFVQIKVKAQQTVQQRSVYPCLYFIKPKNQTD